MVHNEVKNKLIEYILEEEADIAYCEEQISENYNRRDEYLYSISQSREAIATYYDKLMELGLTREEIDREIAYA